MKVGLLAAVIQLCSVVSGAYVETTTSNTYEADIQILEQFNQWLRTQDPTVDGFDLAVQRRQALLRVASEDPKTSILMSEDMYAMYESSISSFGTLPDTIIEQLETPFAGVGTLTFGCFIPESADVTGGDSTYAAQLEKEESTDGFMALFTPVNGVTYTAHIFGSMAELIRHGGDINVQGIMFRAERVVALWENSVRERRRSSDNNDLVEANVATDTGLVNQVYANVQELEQALEEGRREVTKAAIKSRKRRAITSMGDQRKYLVIPIDFSDLPGYPADFRYPTTWNHFDTVGLFEDKIAPFFSKNSYNQLNITFDYLSAPLRMPRTAEFYETGQNYPFLFQDAEDASGFNRANYDTYIVLNTKIGARVGGIGLVGDSGVIINGEFDIRVICHEIGHNYGSWHADEWVPYDLTNPAGNGYMLAYGDPYAAMGLADTTGKRHFSARSKEEFGWIPEVNTREVSISGVYTLYAHDQIVNTPAADQILTLRVPLSNSRHRYDNLHYDIELRGLDVWGAAQGDGVSIRMVIPPGTGDGLTMVVCNEPGSDPTVSSCFTNSGKTRETNGLVLDMTPLTPAANERGRTFRGDGLLTASQSFSDVESMIHVRISELRGTTPAESVRVELIYGTNDCWDQGTFVDGRCECYPGYYSVDCKFETDSDMVIRLTVELSGDDDLWYDKFRDALINLGFGNATYSFSNRVNSAEGSTLLLKLEDLEAKQELRQATAAGALELEDSSITSLSEGDSTVNWPQATTAGNDSGDGKIFGLEPILAYTILAATAIIVGMCLFCCIGSLCKKKRRHDQRRQQLPTVVADSVQNPNPDTKDEVKATAPGGGVYPHLAPNTHNGPANTNANANAGVYPPRNPHTPAPAAQNMSEASLYQVGFSPSPSRASPASQRGSPMMYNSAVLPPHMSQQALYAPSPLSSAPGSPQQSRHNSNSSTNSTPYPNLSSSYTSAPSSPATAQSGAARRPMKSARPNRDSPSMPRPPRDSPRGVDLPSRSDKPQGSPRPATRPPQNKARSPYPQLD